MAPPRALQAWERCERSRFNDAHLWRLVVLDGTVYCHHCGRDAPPEHRARLAEVLRTAREGAGVPADWWRE